jgi:hypothetical protein
MTSDVEGHLPRSDQDVDDDANESHTKLRYMQEGDNDAYDSRVANTVPAKKRCWTTSL